MLGEELVNKTCNARYTIEGRLPLFALPLSTGPPRAFFSRKPGFRQFLFSETQGDEEAKKSQSYYSPAIIRCI